jgi:hypothetical protein
VVASARPTPQHHAPAASPRGDWSTAPPGAGSHPSHHPAPRPRPPVPPACTSR